MAAFHFTKETPPDSTFTDIQSINKFNDVQFQQLTTIAFSFLLDSSKSARLLEQLQEFSEEHGVSMAALKHVSKSLLSVPSAAIKQNLSPSQLKEDFCNLGLSQEKAEYFSKQWEKHLVSLSRSALGQTLMVNQLVDMEWKFGVTAASSDMNKVGNTFLQLKLVINKGNQTENVNMELTLPQFYAFLHEMEKAKASLEYLS